MLSREEAAEMMMRTEFSEIGQRHKNPVSPNSTPIETRSPPEKDDVATKLVAAANQRAEDADRRLFLLEENAALKVADAELQVESAREELAEARVKIHKLEHHIATTALHPPEKSPEKSKQRDSGDNALSSAIAEANNKRLQLELLLDETNAKTDDLEKSLRATRDAACRAIEDTTRDGLEVQRRMQSDIEALQSTLRQETELRLRAEEISNEHERKRIRAIESLLKRNSKINSNSASKGSSFRAALEQGTNSVLDDQQPSSDNLKHIMSASTPNDAALRASRSVESSPSKNNSTPKVALTSAEEDLVAIESEHLRELERLRGDLVVAKAEFSKKANEVAYAHQITKKTKDELQTLQLENRRLFENLDRSDLQLRGKGVSVVLRTLKHLDAIEARTVHTYMTATEALKLAKNACDAAEEVTTNDNVIASVAEIERGVEGNWVFGRDLLHETWGVVTRTRKRLDQVKHEANTLGLQLRKSSEREANRAVRRDIERRSKEFGKLSVTDSYPKFKPLTVSNDFGDNSFVRSSTRTQAGSGFDVHSSVDDDLSTPLRLTRRPMRVGSPTRTKGQQIVMTKRSVSPGPPQRASSERRGRSPGPASRNVRSPSRSVRSPPRSPNPGSRSPIQSRSPVPQRHSPVGITRSPARSPIRSPIIPSSAAKSPSRNSNLRASISPGARRCVTFGENTHVRPKKPPTRPHTAPTRSRVGAYIRGETKGVISPAQEKREIARVAARKAAAEIAHLAALKASNPRSRSTPRPWQVREQQNNTRPQSAPAKQTLRSKYFTSPSKSPLNSFGLKSGVSPVRLKMSSMKGSIPLKQSPLKGSHLKSPVKSPSKSPTRRPSPAPRDAVMPSQRSPSKSPPPPHSRKHRDQIVSRTLRP